MVNNTRVDERLIAKARELGDELEQAVIAASETLPSQEQDRLHREVSRREEEAVAGLALWLGELPIPDFRTVPKPVGADPLISLNLGELLGDYGISCVYLVAEAVLRLYRPYLVRALEVSRAAVADETCK